MKKNIKNFFLFLGLHVSMICYSSLPHTLSTSTQISNISSADSIHTKPFQNSNHSEVNEIRISSINSSYHIDGMGNNNSNNSLSYTPTNNVVTQNSLSTPKNESVTAQCPIANFTRNQEISSTHYQCSDYCHCITKKCKTCCYLTFIDILCCSMFFCYYFKNPNDLPSDCNRCKSDCKKLCCDCEISRTNNSPF
ncbi:MAG TPA: hypothetical protein VLG50_04605 [Candidatus Saccharimonadales bacterium]|nr:hypothetical protein [Candidatus Saccharimonadales bacterium]